MDIFKLFYDHDLRLNTAQNGDSSEEDRLEEFMSPTPTFSKFYLAGTRLEQEKFGLNCLHKFDEIIEKLDAVFSDYTVHTGETTFETFSNAIAYTKNGQPILLAQTDEGMSKKMLKHLPAGSKHGASSFREQLRESLMEEHIIVYKVQAQNGFDLHIFSKDNIYDQFFYPFRELPDEDLRFFSVNSKRMASKRHYYFEVHRLDRPPHGAEEVFEDTKF